MDNPLSLESRTAMAALGRLMRRLALAEDPSQLPGSIEDDGRRLVLDRETFLAMMEAEGASRAEVLLREGDVPVAEVELVRRRADRATLLLPEPEVIKAQMENAALGTIVVVRVPSLYGAFGNGDLDLTSQRLEPSDQGYYVVKLGTDAFEVFIDAYMGSYSPAQCA